MPKIEVIRKGITPAVRAVPTDTTLVVLPMTLERLGMGVEDEDEQPVRLDSVQDAFEQFKPSLYFETTAGEEATEFVAELRVALPYGQSIGRNFGSANGIEAKVIDEPGRTQRGQAERSGAFWGTSNP